MQHNSQLKVRLSKMNIETGCMYCWDILTLIYGGRINEKTILIVLTLTPIFLLSGCSGFFDDSMPCDKIFSYVNESYEKLHSHTMKF